MAAAAATRRAAPSSMAGVDVASTSAQALLQAGLQQDIFARARSGTTEAAASSQSSSSSLMSASCAGLTVSGILSVAQDTMPSPLRPPETSWHAASGLHNSGNWLTGYAHAAHAHAHGLCAGRATSSSACQAPASLSSRRCPRPPPRITAPTAPCTLPCRSSPCRPLRLHRPSTR